MKDNILILEGVGWSDCDTSKATDLKNCRLRTAFKNKLGHVYFMEVIVSASSKSIKQPFPYTLYFSCLERLDILYNSFYDHPHLYPESIEANCSSLLSFVNTFLKCNFAGIETDNSNKYRALGNKYLYFLGGNCKDEDTEYKIVKLNEPYTPSPEMIKKIIRCAHKQQRAHVEIVFDDDYECKTIYQGHGHHVVSFTSLTKNGYYFDYDIKTNRITS